MEKKPYKLSENWENSVRCSRGCSAPSAWQSHKSFISLGCMRVRRCRRSSFEMAPSSTHTQGEYLLCLQTTARWSRLIFLQKAMNKTCIYMHIKSQELTKQNKAKQRCWGSGKGEGESAFSWTCSESLTPPISEGLAQRPSGDAPLLHLDIIAPLEEEQVSAPWDACSRLARHALQFRGLSLSSH